MPLPRGTAALAVLPQGRVTPASPMATPSAPEVRKGLPIVAYLVFGVSALVILSVGAVLLVTLSIATRNTFELLEDKSRLLITSVVQQVAAVPRAGRRRRSRRWRELIESGRLDPADPERLFDGAPGRRSPPARRSARWSSSTRRAG